MSVTEGGRCIAMWSGPRNISTAMMRAWENRADTQVVDEPFYAHFLQHTQLDHPMAEQVIASGETNWRTVVEAMSKPPQSGLFYQKHITTHWLEHYSVEWLDALSHVFLIRQPQAVVASYAVKRQDLTIADLGYSQQAALFDLIRQRYNKQPVVIDSGRFLQAPEDQLRAMCEKLEIPFDPAMLCWPAGSRDTDGVWSAHWYDAVKRSTGFGPVNRNTISLDSNQQHIVSMCQPYYDALAKFAL